MAGSAWRLVSERAGLQVLLREPRMEAGRQGPGHMREPKYAKTYMLTEEYGAKRDNAVA